MGSVSEFLIGIKTLEETESPINGHLKVTKSIAWGTHIQAGGLTQSGGVVYDVWKTTLKKVRKTKPEIKNCLILGLGGGSAAKLVRKLWNNPDIKITGVDIDPIMVNLGKKYLKLDELGIEIKIGDAFKFVKSCKTKFDLILIDTYQGDNFPKEFESDDFLKSVRKLMNKEGITVFNRLYFGEKRKEAAIFNEKLEKFFTEVKPVFPEANVMFVCKL